MNFQDLLTNVKRVNEDLDTIVIESAMENDNFIVDLNTEQLEKGVTNKNETIYPEYRSPEYAQLKKSMGSQAPMGIPNLKLTGDFYSGIIAYSPSKGKISLTSTDEKGGDLKIKYKDIFGLNEESLQQLGEYIKPTLIERITNEITR